MKLDGMTWRGGPVDDARVLPRLPDNHVSFLTQVNGSVAIAGGLHVRGACLSPTWHSLRAVMDGPASLHEAGGQLQPGRLLQAEGNGRDGPSLRALPVFQVLEQAAALPLVPRISC